MTNKQPSRQKNFRVQARLLDAFEAYCARHLFDERVIMESVLLHAMEVGHAELMRMRQRLGAWLTEQDAAAADLEAVERVAGIGHLGARSRRGGGRSRKQ